MSLLLTVGNLSGLAGVPCKRRQVAGRPHQPHSCGDVFRDQTCSKDMGLRVGAGSWPRPCLHSYDRVGNRLIERRIAPSRSASKLKPDDIDQA